MICLIGCSMHPSTSLLSPLLPFSQIKDRTCQANAELRWYLIALVWRTLNFSASCESPNPRQLSCKCLRPSVCVCFLFQVRRDVAGQLGLRSLWKSCGKAGDPWNTGKWWESLSGVQLSYLRVCFQAVIYNCNINQIWKNQDRQRNSNPPFIIWGD